MVHRGVCGLIPFLLISKSMALTCEELQCQNGGICDSTTNGSASNAFCLCPSTYDGDLCEDKRVCSKTCVHGNCLLPFITPSALAHASDDPLATEPYCECDEGYSGILCEAPVRHCPDGNHSCFNGGFCEQIYHSDGRPFKDPRYRCNCDNTDPKNPYVGLSCQHPVERTCSLLTQNIDSFCVNGGRCKDMTTVEGVHMGCHCPDGFEGDHCEFLLGTDPVGLAAKAEEQAAATLAKTLEKEGSALAGGIQGIAVFFIVLASVGVFIGLLVLVRRVSRKRRALQESSSAYQDDDLAFDQDGNRMTNISIQDRKSVV